MSIAKHPAQFIERVIYLNSHPNEISRDELELKDGTILDRYSSPATGKDGKYYGRVWIFRDITARKRAEEALRLLGSAMEQAKESIVITDAELNLPGPKIIFVNPAFTRMTGYTAEEALGKTPRMLQGPRSDRAVLSRLRRNLEQGEVFEGETVNYRKNGEAFNLEWQIAPIRNSSGIITHFVAIQRDITERKRAEEALRTSQQITEGIINAIPVRVFWKDKNLVYLGCNAVFARDAGFADSKDIIGKDDYQMGWRDQAEKYRGDDRQVIEGGCSKLLTEEPQTTPEGKTMTLLSSKIPLRNVKGEISGVIGTYLDITERKQAESLVRQSEERYRSLFDNAKDAIFTIAADGTFTSLNPAVEAMAGISRADWIGQPFAPMVHPDDLPLAGEMFNRTLKGEKTPVHELRGNPSLSRPAIMEMTLAAQKDESGKIIGVLGIGRDITERKQAEEELRLKTAFLEAQVNSSLDGILVVDQNRNVSLQNQRFIDLFKMPLRLADTGADEIRLRWVTDRIKNSEPFVQKVLYLYAHPNEISRDEIELNDGTILDRYSSPAIGKDGKYYGRIWTYHDITERKRDEEALRKIKLQLAHAMSLAQLAAWEYDAASGLFTFSDAYYALHGTTAELENGYRMSAEVFVRKFLHPDDAHLVAAEIGKAVATTDLDYHSQVEARIFRRDGELRHVLVHIAITKDAAGRTIQIQGANQDITERKKLEARLFQSQKMETVGKLAGGIAHEFNSILTAIIGQSELLLGDLPAESPLATSATEISRAANRAATLTRQLLAYGRKQILQPESLDLNKVIASMEGMIHHLLGGDVDVYFVPAHDLQAVKADAGQIEQVVMNVAMNAADAMPQGGKLTIETGNVTLDQEYVSHFPDLKAGGYVMLAITDTGAGMSAEVKARVFEPFFTTKGVGEGTGLGLSTCYGILKQSGGHINVYSEPGHGTTFKIYLPQVEAATTIPSPRLATPDLPRGTETILLVEDDSALREMAATLLKRLGYTVLAAANGIEALTLIHQRDTGHIDLLFTDIVMPHMSGKELADRVQASYPHTRILFTCAYTGNAIVHQGVLDKGVALLQKPFTPAALAHKLREVLDQPIARPPDPAQKSFLFANTSYG
jgi:PAS domain S-box-containing protein